MAEKFPELIEAGLNMSQRRFCKIPENKNIRLLAPAGSGKTFSLLWRCKCIHDTYLQSERPAPHFLIITFTRAARFELESRLQNNETFKNMKLTISTLNAWGWEYMKKEFPGRELVTNSYSRKALVNHDLLSLCKEDEYISDLIKNARGQATNAPVIIDLIDQLKSLGFTHDMKPQAYRAHIKYLRETGLYSLWQEQIEELLKIERIKLNDKSCRDKATKHFFEFWKSAVEQLKDHNRFTMEDQKYWPRYLLEADIKEGNYTHSSIPYTHIFVDEFQDINPLDLELIKAISLYHGKGKALNITIVGDDDQAIFGWRGTTPKYILDPDKYVSKGFKTCVLDTNYRSPKKIVEASSNLINYNTQRVEKDVKSVVKGRATLKVESPKKKFTTIESTVRLAHELLDKKGCDSIALIGRKQGALFPYQVVFSAEGTEYNVAADLDIFEGEAMKSLQSIMRIIYRAQADDSDDPIEDLLTVCDKVDRFQIQKKEKARLKSYLDKKRVESFREALQALKEYPDTVKNQNPDFLYDAVFTLFSSVTVEEFMDHILDDFRGFDKDYIKAEQDVHYKNPQFLRLRELSQNYGANLRQFYRDIDKARRNGERSRKRESDNSDEGYKENQAIKVHLLTATRSKGKEFDAVIVLDADMDEWPNQLSTDIEEERRLFYVAMTRAKKYLYFVTSKGKAPSRFLLEAKLI